MDMKAKKPRKARVPKCFRALHLTDGKWHWKMCGYRVVIFNPSLKKIVIWTKDLFPNMTHNDVERGIYKRWLSVTPGLITEHIKVNIINE